VSETANYIEHFLSWQEINQYVLIGIPENFSILLPEDGTDLAFFFFKDAV
jgi:hypothetical protein